MPHAATQLVPILSLADALGVEVTGRHARCFNAQAHRDKKDEHPSLIFFPDNDRFKCYACGVHGDSIDLVRSVQRCGFLEAVSWIESVAGARPHNTQDGTISLTRLPRQSDDVTIDIYTALYEMSSKVAPEMPVGQYLKKRGLDLDLANQHHVVQMGDPRCVSSKLNEEFGLDSLKTAGLISSAGHFLFARHHLLFFYCDDGLPIYVQARDITGESHAKELSLTGLSSPVPYNVDLIRQPQRRIYVCEGCIDTLSALQMGFPAVGVPGVMGFQDDWFECFKTVEHVVFLFDNDEAGRQQSAELRMLFRLRGIKADSMYPARGKDLNDMLMSAQKGDKDA